MSTPLITAHIGSDGTLSLRNWSNGAQRNPDVRIDLSGLDGRVLRLFERWMTLRDRTWHEEEIATFGELLHRRLFPGDVWSWVEQQAAGASPDAARLMLAFPTDRAASRLAALPWEYLRVPDRPGRNGGFLVLDPEYVVSRVVPSGGLEHLDATSETIRILPVVGDAENPRLGTVQYADVLQAIQATEGSGRFTVLDPVIGATADGVRELLSGPDAAEPHVIHFLGHGRFRDGEGAVALCDPHGGTDWVDEHRLARTVFTESWAPTLVVLHACEGGALDFEERFAGLAPSLVHAGAAAVVAMQYAITNTAAGVFSTALYSSLGEGSSLDEAVQDARRALVGDLRDPRLVGVPMVYQRTADPLFSHPEDGE